LNIYMLLVTCGLVLATFATRTVMLLGRQRFKPSRHIDAALRYAPVCALAVLVVPEVLLHAGAVDVSVTNPRLAGALAASAFVLWNRSIVGCIAVGMTVFAAVRFAW
jgi:branched-subunit amino acid transport protein